MSLAAGTRLGPYEILAPIGAGGMGEVFRAKDSKLDRDVAIKVLPESVAANPEMLARFEREAKAVAALAALIAKYEKDAPSNIAGVYAYHGEADKAFVWLDKAVEYGDPGIGEIVTENLFDKVHKDPRWLPFLRKIGKAPEQLAKIDFRVTLPK